MHFYRYLKNIFSILVLTGMALSINPCASASVKNDAAEYVKLDKVTLYVEHSGQGTPVIFLHGGMGSANAWKNQVPVFAKQYRVITPDSRGQGRSSDTEGPLTYHLMAEDIIQLMDKLHIPAAYVVGWSDGGNIGIDMAVHHPARIKALVAYGANIFPSGLQKYFLDYLQTAQPQQLQQDMAGEYRALSATPEHLPDIVDKIKTMWLTQPQFSTAELAGIQVPTLIIDGEQEEIIRVNHAREIAQAIPAATLVMMPDVGHYAPSARTKEWNKIVLDFLARH